MTKTLFLLAALMLLFAGAFVCGVVSVYAFALHSHRTRHKHRSKREDDHDRNAASNVHALCL